MSNWRGSSLPSASLDFSFIANHGHFALPMHSRDILYLYRNNGVLRLVVRGLGFVRKSIEAVRKAPPYYWVIGIMAVAVDAWWDSWFN